MTAMEFKAGDKVRVIKEPENRSHIYWDAQELLKDVINRKQIGIILGGNNETGYRVSFASGLLVLPESVMGKVE